MTHACVLCILCILVFIAAVILTTAAILIVVDVCYACLVTSPSHSRDAVHQCHTRLSPSSPTISAPPLTPLSSRLNALAHSSLLLSLSVVVPPLCRCFSTTAARSVPNLTAAALFAPVSRSTPLKPVFCGSPAPVDLSVATTASAVRTDPFLMPSSRQSHHSRHRLESPHLAPLLPKLSAAAVTRARTFSYCLLPVNLPAPPANCCCCCHSCSHRNAQPLLDPDVFHKSTSIVGTAVECCFLRGTGRNDR